MDKKILLIIALILIAGAIIFFIFTLAQQRLTGASITEKYSFTKAICDESNYCQDYEIVCQGDQVVSTNPITGAAVDYPDDWEDPRTQDQIQKSC